MASSSTSESTNKAYLQALSTAISTFRSLHSNPTSSAWKPLPTTSSSSSASSASSSSTLNPSSSASHKNLINGIGSIEPGSLTVHKRSGGRAGSGVEIWRAACEVGVGEGLELGDFEAVLGTEEVRSSWDKLVEHSQVLELLDPQTKITKTDYRLGWPASPRDTVTISRTMTTPTELLVVATSLPRSADEPAFLRPAPPYVRSHVHVLAWHVQLLPPSTTSSSSTSSSSSAPIPISTSLSDDTTSTFAPAGASPTPSSSSTLSPSATTTTNIPTKARITLYWQWSLKGIVFTNPSSSLSSLLASFVNHVRTQGNHLPVVGRWGKGVAMSRVSWEVGRGMGGVDYCVVRSSSEGDKGEEETGGGGGDGEVEIDLGQRGQGWDVKVVTKGIGEGVDGGFVSELVGGNSGSSGEAGGDVGTVGRVKLVLRHGKVEGEGLVRVTVGLHRLAGGKTIKVNGEVVPTKTPSHSRDPTPRSLELFDDTASIASFSSASGSSPSLAPSFPIPPTPSAASTEIASLLRRNYIYFTSLLQEPEAKWRHVSDSSGVTVTQLNSIDPTLTIYRAEATFVGVGVWDVFSTIVTPGARGWWEKGLEGAELLEEVDELTQVWWSRMKASWPVAPRDSVTIRTAYKSPSSVHIFSFSTDDTNLFPSIPPCTPPTIRTQTDLYGWAIEALSPTTTQITLLDQSDPKGWSNKSWTPTQMVSAVAGVGDFSIKFGGPPVVTRLEGARATVSAYEHEKGMLRTEYKKTSVGSSASASAASMAAGGLGIVSSGNSAGEGAGTGETVVECEVRCDVSTWASSIDIVIDPPPMKVSCLSRHRLSSGGGLWVTISHDASLLSKDERVLVSVKKGGGGREKGSVVVNGTKMFVDVEMLPEDEVKLLSKRKRVKASPIPLDQYSTHGPRAWTPRSFSGREGSPGRAGGLSTPPVANVEDPIKAAGSALSAVTSSATPTTVVGSPSSSSPLAQPPVTSAATSCSSTPTASVAEVLPPSSSSSKPLLPPPAQALEALSWLQTFHAEQGPELTDPAPGWAIVSERQGTVTRKKIIPRVSEVLPVYRGDKIVQGLTAEEMASVVSAVGCRKAWDERVETAMPLATYGYGCSTAVMTTKPTFPFKGRIFHVASINAQVRVPSASAAASTSTVLFCASSSYTPDATFDSNKVNPAGLLPGQVLLEGWILETLDPYTSSMLAIPSTRCTYVACVDHSGSVPLAQSVLNANLPRVISSVEQLAKAKGPLPRLWMPDSGLQIEGALSEDGDQECVWRLSTVGRSSVLLTSDYSIEDGVFRSLYRISGPASTTRTPATPHKIMPSTPVGSMLKSELPRSVSLNFGPSSSSPSNLTLQKPSNGDLARKASLNSLRSAFNTPSSSSPMAVKRSLSPTKPTEPFPPVPDLVVAELVVDLKQFPHGYSIACSSAISLEPSEPLSIEPPRSLADRQIPLYATAHDAPLPSIVSASLDSVKRTNHLVRILVQTSKASASSAPASEGDPKKPAPLSPPDWLAKLCERGAVVDVRVVPLPADASEKAGSGTTRVMFNGEKLAVLSQKESRAVLSRLEDEDWDPKGSTISRVPRKRKTASTASSSSSHLDVDLLPSLLPTEFQQPVAVAVRLLAPKPVTPVLEDAEFPDPKSPGAHTPNGDEEGARSPDIPSVPSVKRDHSLSDASTTAGGQFLNMLGAYPLSRLGSSMTLTTTTGGGRNGEDGGSEGVQQRTTYTLSFVMIVGLIAFLLGSLLRSLLTPADYIIYAPLSALPTSPKETLHNQQVERALMQAFDPTRRWREARRLLELRGLWFSKWDYIVAAVRRD